jgi:FkbM family methyltransferase
MMALFRRAAEMFLGPLIVQRRLPSSAGGGRLVANARVGGLKYLFKSAADIDPELLRIAGLLVKKDDVVWDVGANVGLFSVVAAARAGANGRVISVEADLDAVTLLNRTVALRSDGHAAITVLPLAVGRSIGFVHFLIAGRARAANAIKGYGSTQMGGIREERVLPSMNLDCLLEHFSAPQVLKIDVEGAENEVLLGAKSLLLHARPLIYCEVASSNADDITALLRFHRYRIWDGATYDGRGAGEVTHSTHNTVAIPEEKVHLV